MQDAGLFQIQPAAPLCGRLAVERSAQPLVFAILGGEGLDRPHVRDRVDQLAGHQRALFCVGTVQRPAPAAEQGDESGHDGCSHDQRQGDAAVDRHQDRHRAQEVDARGNDVPGQTAQCAGQRTGGRRDAAAERARQVAGKELHPVSGQMPKEIEPDVDACPQDDPAAEPARQSRQDALAGDEAEKQRQCAPDHVREPGAGRHVVDDQLHAVLRPHGTARGQGHEQDQKRRSGTSAAGRSAQGRRPGSKAASGRHGNRHGCPMSVHRRVSFRAARMAPCLPIHAGVRSAPYDVSYVVHSTNEEEK